MSRTIKLSLLDNIGIASPCPANWDDMQGDDRSRFCQDCHLSVYNISAMSREEAEALIIEKEGSLCVRLMRRADGTVLTRDCPVGLRRARQQAARVVARIGVAVAMLLGSAVSLGGPRGAAAGARLRRVQPFATICQWISPAPPPAPMGRPFLLGSVRPAPRPIPTAAAPRPAPSPFLKP